MNAVILGCIMFTAACGSGSDSSENPISENAFDEANSAASDLTFSFLDANGEALSSAVRATDDVIATTTGNVTYEGYITGGTEDDGNFVASLELTADFVSSELVGSASDFRFEDNTALAGTITGAGSLSSGTSDGTFPQATVTLSGTLVDDGVSRPTEIALDGYFYEADSSDIGAIAGLAEGDIGASEIEDGLFAAQQ